MTITRVLAQSTVTDLAVAEEWYSKLFARVPDSRPMPGLLEWRLTEASGVQVWSEPERAGRSSMVLDEADLDGLAARLNALGITDDSPHDATSLRILRLVDPDGNRVVFTGAFT
jgi:hypothetical protein